MTGTGPGSTNDTGRRPWWASDGPIGRGPDPDEDPVEAYRAARRGAMRDEARPGWAGHAGDGEAGEVAANGVAGIDTTAGDDTTAAGPDATAGSDAAGGDTAGSGTAGDDATAGSGTAGHDTAAGPDATAGSGTPGDAPDGVHRPELCGICPICTGFRALEELRPDLVAHLSEAARHLAAAFRAVAETTSPPPSHSERDAGGTGRAPPPVQHIDLD